MATAAGLTKDHISWLLVLAYNCLQQNLPERSITLLEFLRVFDKDNPQCMKMLAYAYFLHGQVQKSTTLMQRLQRLSSLTEAERADIRLLGSRIMALRDDSTDGAQRLAQNDARKSLTQRLESQQNDS